jgi:hypothetical protein
VFLTGSLARWPVLVTPALLGLGIAAVVPVATASGTVGETVLLAALLVATGELAGWTEDLRSTVASPPAELRARAAAISAWAAVAMVVATGALAVAGLGAPSESTAIVLGTVASLLVLSFAALRRWRDPT